MNDDTDLESGMPASKALFEVIPKDIPIDEWVSTLTPSQSHHVYRLLQVWGVELNANFAEILQTYSIDLELDA